MKLFNRRAKPSKKGSSQKLSVDMEESDSAANYPTQGAQIEASESSFHKDGSAPIETSVYKRLRASLGRSSGHFADGLTSLVKGKKQLDAELLEALQEQLIIADLGLETTERVLESVRLRLARNNMADTGAVLAALKEALVELLDQFALPLVPLAQKPFVILVVGVNGAGKTTTIGKLAYRYQKQGLSVMLAAGDTFRAAAVEQLQEWGERCGIPVIAQHTGADSASVLYDAVQAASARGIDVLIADTAGRLQNKTHLMDELSKAVRVMRKLNGDLPHETLLVLDAGTGRNAVSQAVEFDRAVGVTGIALTKLDGTARGGVIFAIADTLQRPIRLIGIGEQVEDLRDFYAGEFVEAIFDSGQVRDSSV